MNHNFNILNGDTDSITLYKEKFEEFLESERIELLKELNNQCPKGLTWEDDGYYKMVVIIKAKNYVLYDGKKTVIKGSALKASTKSPKLKQLIKDVIYNILEDKNDYVAIYKQYVKEVAVITDITPWCVRKTVTKSVLTSSRKNETNVKDAIEGSNYREGDRCHMFYKEDGTLCLAENFNGEYSKNKLYLQLFDTLKVFKTILDMKDIKNYKLKRAKIELETL